VAPKPLCSLSYISPERIFGQRQATTLLKFAKSTSDPRLAAALVEKAAELKSQIDETMPPDPSPQPPDVERSA
jgi:hypothetical protein